MSLPRCTGLRECANGARVARFFLVPEIEAERPKPKGSPIDTEARMSVGAPQRCAARETVVSPLNGGCRHPDYPATLVVAKTGGPQ